MSTGVVPLPRPSTATAADGGSLVTRRVPGAAAAVCRRNTCCDVVPPAFTRTGNDMAFVAGTQFELVSPGRERQG